MTIDYIGGFSGSGGGGTGVGGIDWNAPVSNSQLDAVMFPILGQNGADPLGLAGLFPANSPVGPGHGPESVGARYNAVTNMSATQRNQLGDILAVALGQAPKTDYSVRSVQDMLDTAFRQAGESGATNLSDYLSKQVTAAQQNGQAGADSIHVIAPTKVGQTTYTAADIQATADAVGQKLLGRNLTAEEMQGVLNVMNTASATKAQAQASADTAALQQQMSTQNAMNNPGANTSAGGVSPAGGKVSPQQVYQEAIRQGGTQAQAQVAAALVSGIESNGDPTELAGGVGPAQGLFQFEPGTWTGSAGGGKGGLPATVGAASWQQQVTGFLNATKGDNFGAWGPDVVAARGNPNSTSNPAYGYSGPVQQGSVVANWIQANAASLGGSAAIGTAPSGSKSGTTDVYQSPVISQIPADPTAAEAATNFIETQRSPDYQKNNLLNVFEMIESNLKSPVPNQKVMSSPVVMK